MDSKIIVKIVLVLELSIFRHAPQVLELSKKKKKTCGIGRTHVKPPETNLAWQGFNQN